MNKSLQFAWLNYAEVKQKCVCIVNLEWGPSSSLFLAAQIAWNISELVNALAYVFIFVKQVQKSDPYEQALIGEVVTIFWISNLPLGNCLHFLKILPKLS